MADTKISALGALGGTPAVGDLIPVVDVSDTTQGAAGSTKMMTAANMAALAPQGDVVGPASSVDNQLVRYSGTTGKLVDAVTGVTLSDAGVLILPVGSAAAPSYALGSGNGFSYDGNGGIIASHSGTAFVSLGSGGVSVVGTLDAGFFGWNSSFSGAWNTTIGRAANNSIVFGGSSPAAGAATTRTEMNKAITAITDATATTVFTVTIPNAAHSASIEVTLTGSLGAGGAIGANEATGTIKYLISVARTSGVNAVATISTAFGSSTSAVAGAATITVTGDLGAITGAVGAPNTFTIRTTVTKGSGSSANHTCLASAVLLNANTTGITIA